MFEDDLPNLLEDVALRIKAYMWLLQDEATLYFSFGILTYLNEAFPNPWIKRNGPVIWALRSLDRELSV